MAGRFEFLWDVNKQCGSSVWLLRWFLQFGLDVAMENLVAGVILGLCESGFMRQTFCCEVVDCTLDLLAACCN